LFGKKFQIVSISCVVPDRKGIMSVFHIFLVIFQTNFICHAYGAAEDQQEHVVVIGAGVSGLA
jgi:threonine dehydrogenase-like Zn-dependent dehydrogenase